MKEKIQRTIQNFIKNNSKNILWVYGRSGCGKTNLISSLSKEFRSKDKKVYLTSADKFVSLLIKLIISDKSVQSLISYCQNYDLVILDDMGIKLSGKLKTQAEIKSIILAVVKNKKTKIVLASKKRPRNLPVLKFHTRDCQYLGLKAPEYDMKVNLLKKWIKEKNLVISEKAISLTANAAKNLFELRGLFNQFYFNKLKVPFIKKKIKL